MRGLFYTAALLSFASALTWWANTKTFLSFELFTLKLSSRSCDGYTRCDQLTKSKKTTTCEADQVCFFREEIAIVAYNVTIDPMFMIGQSMVVDETQLTQQFQQQLMAKNKQIVQVAHMETAGCLNKNSTLADKKQQADCEVDLHAELYRIKV